jgi:hypothetical protein
MAAFSRRAGGGVMKPAEYVREVVLPTAHEYNQDRRSRRLMYLTCIAVFHIKDHLAKAGEEDINERMRSAVGQSFDVVRAICNGTKHAGPDKRNRIKFRPGEDFDRPPARAGEMEAGISRSGDLEGGREIGFDPSKRFTIYEECIATLKAFCVAFPDHFRHCDLSGL